jgi:hypothetical protein
MVKNPLIGTLWETSWGYDQTNYDFIMITAVSPSGKTATCRRIHYQTLGSTGQSNIQKPVASAFGDSFQMKIQKYEDKIYLRGSYPYLHTGEISKNEYGRGGVRLGTFSQVKEGDVFYETDPQFGH